MSNEEAEKFMEEIDRKSTKQARHDFLDRMERKLYRKEHNGRS